MSIASNPLNDISRVYLDQIAEKKDDSYLETDFKKRQKNNEKARKEMEKVKDNTVPRWMREEEISEAPYQVYGSPDGKKTNKIGKPVKSKRYAQNRADELSDTHKGTGGKYYIQKEALDPVGREDADIDNDGDVDKSDKYLHKRRKAISKAMKKRMSEQEEKIGGGNLKGLIKKAVKRIDADNDGDVDKDDPKETGMGEFVPSPDGKKKIRTSVRTEGFSDWRQDLSEVMDDIEANKEIKDKKINNKIKINPEMKEAIEKIGGTIIEMVEIDEAVYGGKKEEQKDNRYTVTAADKKANTPAYQNYMKGDKRYKMVGEKLNLKTAEMGEVIKDFQKSDAPQFKGRTKEERRQMAIAAKLTAERGGKRLGEQQEEDDEQERNQMISNKKKMMQKQQMLQKQQLQMQKQGKLPLNYGEETAFDKVKSHIISKYGKGAIYDPKAPKKPSTPRKPVDSRTKREKETDGRYLGGGRYAGD